MPERSRTTWLRACEAFLRTTLAYSQFLRAHGRLGDPESALDIASLEEQHRLIVERLAEVEDLPRRVVALPSDPAKRMAFAASRQLRIYREAVCAESRQLRARSQVLVRQARAVRAVCLVGSDGATNARPAVRR